MKVRREIGLSEISREIFEIEEKISNGIQKSIMRYIVDVNKLRDKLILKHLCTETLEEFIGLVNEELDSRKAEEDAKNNKELVTPVTESDIKVKKKRTKKSDSK